MAAKIVMGVVIGAVGLLIVSGWVAMIQAAR
jgi:hypothetical protein